MTIRKSGLTRAFLPIGTYFAGLLVCVVICLLLNGRTPILKDGQTLPADWQEKLYLLEGFREEAAGVYTFSIRIGEADRSGQVPVLTITDASPFVLYEDGEEIFSYHSQDVYSRSQMIPLKPMAPGERILQLDMQLWGSGQGELLLGSSSVPKVLIGTDSVARSVADRYSHVATLFTGLYIMMIFSSLTLFLRRRQERYLLALTFVALASMTVMLVESYVPAFHISQGKFARIRSPLFLCPVIATAAIGFYLFYEQVPARVRPYLTSRNLLLATGAVVGAQFFLQYNLNFLLRMVLIIPLLTLFCCASLKGCPGSRTMALGCGISAGARLVIYLVNTLKWFPAGELLIYLRVTQLGYMIYLMLCMTVIYQRYADKFSQAETLVRTLDAKVDERTEQLQQAYRQLERAQTREHEMMTNVLHDLRTPIFHLQGFLNMLKPGEPEDAALVERMKERTDYLNNLAQNLFLTAKLEDNQITFNLHPVDLTSMLRYLADNTRISAQPKEIIVREKSEADVSVLSDGFRIRQILENLLDNAIKYTPKGGCITLELSAAEEVGICVSNTGPDIPPEALPRVFDRFYHGETSGSTGLGLYIAHTMAECLGGRITVRSRDGLTAFTLYIPGKQEEDIEA